MSLPNAVKYIVDRMRGSQQPTEQSRILLDLYAELLSIALMSAEKETRKRNGHLPEEGLSGRIVSIANIMEISMEEEENAFELKSALLEGVHMLRQAVNDQGDFS